MLHSYNLSGEGAGSQFDHQSLPGATDVELLAALSGDPTEIFWRLWERHQETIYQVCLREMGGQTADAEDALSQVMLKSWECLPAYAPEITYLKAWLSQMARNLCVDLRRKARQQSVTAENWKVLTQPEPIVEQPMLHREQAAEIRQWIDALPPRLREPFESYVVQEIPVQQVATQLGLSPANVRKRVQLARAWLRREWTSGRTAGGNPVANQPRRLPAKPVPARKLGEGVPSAVGSVSVKLPCGVEELFHVFAAETKFAPGRKIRSLQNQLSRHPENVENRELLGDLLYHQGDWLRAVDEWQCALALRPRRPTALKLGQVLLELGQAEKAVAVFNRVRREKSRSAADRHLSGWIAYGQRDAGRSAAEFRAGADLEPGNPVHWHGLARAQRLANRLPEALAAIQRALVLNANDLVALSLGHEMLMTANQVAEALRRAQRLLELAPSDCLTLWRLVEVRCRLKLTRGAAELETKQLLRRALRQSRNTCLAQKSLAAFCRSQGELTKALGVLRKFAAEFPQCPSVRQSYWNLLAETGRREHPSAEPRGRKSPRMICCYGGCQWRPQAFQPGA